MNPTLKDIVTQWLRDRGYGGLFNADLECGCEADDLFPCDHPGDDCQAGYASPARDDCDFYISADKPTTENEP